MTDPAGRVSRRRALSLVAAGTASVAGLVACQPARLVRRDPSRRLVLRINVYGSAAYAPLLMMRERRLLEDAIPGLSVEWKVIPAPEAVNEALRDGGLDIATGSPTALLAAREAALPARVVAAISALPCAIVGRAGLQSLAGIGKQDRIAVPEPSSFESALLQLAALQEFGDPRALEPNLLYRSDAEALPALRLGKDMAAHVAMTPVLELELDGSGPEKLTDSRELFGGLPTTALAYALPNLHDRSGALIKAFADALAEGARRAQREPVGTARLISETVELKSSPERLGGILDRSGWQLAGLPFGVTRLAELWHLTGRLRQSPASWIDLAFDGVDGG